MNRFFLGADQGRKRIILFKDEIRKDNILIKPSKWGFPKPPEFLKFQPTDAKRVDMRGRISVIIATSHEVYEVPFNYKDKITVGIAVKGCHSVEKLPDGNLISISSKGNRIRLHYDKYAKGSYYFFNKYIDYNFSFGHGVVYQKNKNVVWALGNKLLKFLYLSGPLPSLELIDTYTLPNRSGHDLFPMGDGNLLFTLNSGVYKFNISDQRIHQISDIRSVKSAVKSFQSGELFLSAPNFKLGYRRWQTNTITNLTNNTTLIKEKSKFYKVRLWEKNEFSYGSSNQFV